jgi:hypothetical protein
MSRGIINKDYLGNLPFYWVVFEAETELEAIRNTIDELERILKLAEKDVLKENDSLDAKLQCNSVNKGSSFLSVVSDTTRIRKMLMEKYFLTNQKK